ncbi:MAG: hypothetical protein ACTSWL_07140 [Promethearchaeota archaeon]
MKEIKEMDEINEDQIDYKKCWMELYKWFDSAIASTCAYQSIKK